MERNTVIKHVELRWADNTCRICAGTGTTCKAKKCPYCKGTKKLEQPYKLPVLADVTLDGYRLQLWNDGADVPEGSKSDFKISHQGLGAYYTVHYRFCAPDAEVIFEAKDYAIGIKWEDARPMRGIRKYAIVKGLLRHLFSTPNNLDKAVAGPNLFTLYTARQNKFVKDEVEQLRYWIAPSVACEFPDTDVRA